MLQWCVKPTSLLAYRPKQCTIDLAYTVHNAVVIALRSSALPDHLICCFFSNQELISYRYRYSYCCCCCCCCCRSSSSCVSFSYYCWSNLFKKA